MMNAKETAQAILRDVFTDESRWCRGALAVDEHGRDAIVDEAGEYKTIEVRDPEAYAWCLLGACRKVQGDEDALAIEWAHWVDSELNYPSVDDMAEWNDVSAYGEVRDFLESVAK